MEHYQLTLSLKFFFFLFLSNFIGCRAIFDSDGDSLPQSVLFLALGFDEKSPMSSCHPAVFPSSRFNAPRRQGRKGVVIVIFFRKKKNPGPLFFLKGSAESEGGEKGWLHPLRSEGALQSQQKGGSSPPLGKRVVNKLTQRTYCRVAFCLSGSSSQSS